MYKRRDWLHLHGGDGGASSDSDGEGSSDPASSDVASQEGSEEADSSSDEEQASPPAEASIGDNEDRKGGADSASDDEPLPTRRLEDLSEDDFDDESDEDLEQLISVWMDPSAVQKEASSRALKCRNCEGVLLLNAVALRQHITSKRHRKTLNGEEPVEPICWAESLTNDENVETHGERIQRLQQEKAQQKQAKKHAQAQKPSEPAAPKSRPNKKRRQKDNGKAAKSKPGKRQRQAMKTLQKT